MSEATLGSSEIESACRNCEAPLAAGQRFCSACGQRTGAQRLTMGGISHDLIHAFTHADHSIFALIKALVLHPGQVARDYIEGRRKRHFGPFGFLVIMVGIATFLIAVLGIDWFTPIKDPRSSGFLRLHINIVILLQMPMLAAWCWLFFRKPKLNYAEHLVLAAYVTGFRVLLLAFVATPAMYFADATPMNKNVVWVYFGVWLCYFAFAAVQFYEGARWWVVIRAVFAAFMAQATMFGLIFVYIWLYAVTAPVAQVTAPVRGCYLDGPSELMPDEVRQIHIGMTWPELTKLLGEENYSPIDGQYYFSTGGDCPLDDTEHLGGCGVVAEFRDYSVEPLKVTDRLKACSWGGIGE